MAAGLFSANPLTSRHSCLPGHFAVYSTKPSTSLTLRVKRRSSPSISARLARPLHPRLPPPAPVRHAPPDPPALRGYSQVQPRHLSHQVTPPRRSTGEGSSAPSQLDARARRQPGAVASRRCGATGSWKARSRAGSGGRGRQRSRDGAGAAEGVTVRRVEARGAGRSRGSLQSSAGGSVDRAS